MKPNNVTKAYRHTIFQRSGHFFIFCCFKDFCLLWFSVVSSKICYIDIQLRNGWLNPFCLPDEFLFPDGTKPGVQQPVHEPARAPRPSIPPWKHGHRHECIQHERPPDGNEPAQGPRHGTFWDPRPKDAPAGLCRTPASGHGHAGYEKTVPRGGEWMWIQHFCLQVLAHLLYVSCFCHRCIHSQTMVGSSMDQTASFLTSRGSTPHPMPPGRCRPPTTPARGCQGSSCRASTRHLAVLWASTIRCRNPSVHWTVWWL